MKKIMIFLMLTLMGCSYAKVEKKKIDNYKISTEIYNKPNYVTTNKKDEKHYIKPILFNKKEDNIIKEELIKNLKKLNGKILIDKENYIKVAFYSKFFKFEDIAEFEISFENSEILLRSGAQTGYYDFGVNRKRIETLRTMLNKKNPL